ncbi:hypothetical protein [Pseudonocardia sp. DLS-67]
MSIDWGSAPDWFAGVGAVLALLWARKAAKAAHETSKSQSVQLKQIEEDKRRAQAECIAAWAEWSNHDGLTRPVIRLVNTSTVPVYHVAVYAINPDTAKLLDLREPAVLAPSGTPRKLLIRARSTDEIETLSDVGILFVDAANRLWHRDPKGRLLEKSEAGYDALLENFISRTPVKRDYSTQFDDM